jgi:hypothetical protein
LLFSELVFFNASEQFLGSLVCGESVLQMISVRLSGLQWGTYGKSLPNFVVSAVFVNHAAAFASVLGPEEEAARLDHDGQLIGKDLLGLALMDPHAMLVALVEATMGSMSSFEATTTRLEVVATSQAFSIDTG